MALIAPYLVYVAAEFHRYATYRQAMVAALFTNCVFGFMRSAVLLAVGGAGVGAVAGYDVPRLATKAPRAPPAAGIVSRLATCPNDR